MGNDCNVARQKIPFSGGYSIERDSVLTASFTIFNCTDVLNKSLPGCISPKNHIHRDVSHNWS